MMLYIMFKVGDLMGLINYCDEKITILKENNIEFVNGIPQIPKNMYYDDIPEYIETYQFRNEIPIDKQKKSLICFYSDDKRLWNRLNTIEKDCEIFKNYGGIVGMDLSISVFMLKIRQRFFMKLNAIYNCLVALHGIKIAINARIGDLSTLDVIKNYPSDKLVVFGNIGCKKKIPAYSYYVIEKWIKFVKLKTICVYGTITDKDLWYYKKMRIDLTIHCYFNHNNRNKHKKNVFIIRGNEYTRNKSVVGNVCDYILYQSDEKINSHLVTLNERRKLK